MVGAECGRQAVRGQLRAVALDARETNLEVVALRSDRSDLNRLYRWRGLGDNRLSREVERNAEDIGVLRIEQTLVVQVVRLAPQRAAHDLLAEKLRAKRPD